jgi:hypothetical protein
MAIAVVRLGAVREDVMKRREESRRGGPIREDVIKREKNPEDELRPLEG